MPNVRRLLARQGTTFDNAVDSFPLCCPSRATFITGQYAHNHGVLGNFFPYGWYGMKNRRNTLPAWLHDSGYRTAAIGKWLNGYGARDAHGEVPARLRHLARAPRRLRLRLLQLRDEHERQAEDLGRRGVRAQPGRVREDRGRRQPDRPGGRAGPAREGDGPAPVRLLGHGEDGGLLARRHRQGHRGTGQGGEVVEEALLHLVVAGRAAPRGRRHHADGPPRPRPAPGAPLREEELVVPAAPARELQRGRLLRQAGEHDEERIDVDRGADRPAPARLRGADRVAARGRRPREEPGHDARGARSSSTTR